MSTKNEKKPWTAKICNMKKKCKPFQSVKKGQAVYCVTQRTVDNITSIRGAEYQHAPQVFTDYNYLSHVMRKPVFAICEQQRH